LNSWQKALALALGLPSTIIALFFITQQLVEMGIVTQGWAQIILLAVVCSILIKMIMVSWKKK
jgi:hypothetical protein